MPSNTEAKKHGGVVRVRTFRRNGKLYRVYFYRDRKTYVDRVRSRKRGKTKR